MTVALVGGLDRLERHYQSAAQEHGIDLRVFTNCRRDLPERINRVDAVVMFTDLVSHQSAREVYKCARQHDLCLLCSHTSSLSAARRCFGQLKGLRTICPPGKKKGGGTRSDYSQTSINRHKEGR